VVDLAPAFVSVILAMFNPFACGVAPRTPASLVLSGFWTAIFVMLFLLVMANRGRARPQWLYWPGVVLLVGGDLAAAYNRYDTCGTAWLAVGFVGLIIVLCTTWLPRRG
jgi:hypothetical protein